MRNCLLPMLPAAVLLAAAVLAAGCSGKPAQGPASAGLEKKKAPPSRVEGSVKESELATVTLTPEAEKRLGIATATVESRPVARSRQVGGELMVPPGRSLQLAAPVAGTLLAAPGARLLAPGAQLLQGQAIVRLAPLPPADRETARDRTQQEVAEARVRLDLARTRAARAERLLAERATSLKAVETARGEQAQAEAALASARERLAYLSEGDLEKLALRADASITLSAPRSGVLRELLVAPGQSVAAGAILAVIDSLDPLWVKVPIYVGDLAAVDATREARVATLGTPATLATPGAAATGRSIAARPIAAVPSASPATATADLFFEVDNPEGALRPGEKVTVTLAFAGTELGRVLPWSAVLFDVDGGAWVYQVIEPHKFARKRIELKQVIDGSAVVSRGPEPGAQVVTAGAAELYGTEFGAK